MLIRKRPCFKVEGKFVGNESKPCLSDSWPCACNACIGDLRLTFRTRFHLLLVFPGADSELYSG